MSEIGMFYSLLVLASDYAEALLSPRLHSIMRGRLIQLAKRCDQLMQPDETLRVSPGEELSVGIDYLERVNNLIGVINQLIAESVEESRKRRVCSDSMDAVAHGSVWMSEGARLAREAATTCAERAEAWAVTEVHDESELIELGGIYEGLQAGILTYGHLIMRLLPYRKSSVLQSGGQGSVLTGRALYEALRGDYQVVEIQRQQLTDLDGSEILLPPFDLALRKAAAGLVWMIHREKIHGRKSDEPLSA